MNAIEKSIELLAEKYDTILEKLEKQNNDIIALTKRAEVLNSVSGNGGDEVKLQLNELEKVKPVLEHGNTQLGSVGRAFFAKKQGRERKQIARYKRRIQKEKANLL